MLPWQLNSLSESSNSLISNANLLSKVYFPRLVVPTSAVVVSFVDFLFPRMILLGLMAWYNYALTLQTLTLPLFIAINFLQLRGQSLCIFAFD